MNPIENVDVSCPYCGERICVSVDCSAGSQEYVEDCQVCCRPITLRVAFDESNGPVVTASDQDNA